MNIHDLIRKAQEREKIAAHERRQDYFVNTLAWFGYLGILKHNIIKPNRVDVTLTEVIKAAKIEPRIYELLPAILITLPGAIQKAEALPEDLKNVLELIRRRKNLISYQNITPEKYMHWIQSPVFEMAKRRLDYRKSARKTHKESTALGTFIRERRIRLAFTQRQFAETHQVSLRVLRDVEQGKKTGSLTNIEAILEGLGATLYWRS